MIDNPFVNGGTIRVTLPGHAGPTESEQRKKPKQSRDVFAYPHLTREQLANKRIRLSSGKVVRVEDVSDEEFLDWYHGHLNLLSVNNNCFGHVRARIMKGIDPANVDRETRWYLLEEMLHLPSFTRSGVQLFVEEKRGAA